MKHALLIILVFPVFILHAQDSTAHKLKQQKKASDTPEYQDLREVPAKASEKAPQRNPKDTFEYQDVGGKGRSSDEVDSALRAPKEFDPNDSFGLTHQEMIEKAREDAINSYGGHHAGKIFALCFLSSTFASPVVGLVPSLACSLSFNEKHADFPHFKLSQNEVYRKEYFKYCKRIKRGMSWGGWIGGVVIDAVVAGCVVYFVKTKND